jgi:hypothetical protein
MLRLLLSSIKIETLGINSMGYLLQKNSYDKIYQSDSLDDVIEVMRKLFSNNSLMQKGEALTIQVTSSEWDTVETQ